VVFAQAVGLTVGSEDRFREREYMAVLAQTVRLALDFERIVVAGLATSGSLHHRDVHLSEMRAARRVGPLLHGRLFRRLLAAQAEAANPRQAHSPNPVCLQTGLGYFDNIGHARIKFCFLTLGQANVLPRGRCYRARR
jgi:hypothetical protein